MIEASRVVAIVLAAGSSRRFGEADKLVADYHGRPLVALAVETAISLPFRAVLAVCREAGPVAGLLRGRGIAVRFNPMPERGMGSSIAIGIAAASAFDPEACLILLGDMPAVTTSHLEAMLGAFDGKDDVVVSASRGRRTPPTLFGRRHFSTLLALDRDEGARALAAQARTVDVADEVLRDVDRPGDL